VTRKGSTGIDIEELRGREIITRAAKSFRSEALRPSTCPSLPFRLRQTQLPGLDQRARPVRTKHTHRRTDGRHTNEMGEHRSVDGVHTSGGGGQGSPAHGNLTVAFLASHRRDCIGTLGGPFSNGSASISGF
jgi:hypothetical protein